MKAARLTMAAAALAAGALVLTGCEPSGSRGGSYSGPTCDPNGFGPLSECDGSEQPDASSPTPESPAAAEPAAPAGPDREPAGGQTAPCDGDGSADSGGSRWAFADSESCADGGNPDAGQDTPKRSRKITTWEGYSVTVTWIVVDIKVTGFRECVIALRQAGPDPDDHFSRRITTPQDCKAQRLDAVYRPVDE